MQFDFSAHDSTVAMTGDFTFTDHPAFLQLMKRLLGSPGAPMIIDLSQLTFIDSAGLGMLLIARDEAGKAKRSLSLRRPRGQIQRMFSVSKFSTLFTIET